MKSYARTSTVLAVGVSLLVLAGCSGDDDGPGEGGTTTLRLVQSGDAAQGGAFQALADKYEEETGIQVEVVEIPNEDLQTSLRTSAQANDLPDLAASPNVDPVWKDRVLDLTEIADEVGVIETLQVRDPEDDRVKAIPTTLTSVGMFLNTSLWDEAGVEYPTSLDESWTWDEFRDRAEEVMEATGAQYGAVVDPSAHRLRAFLYQFGSLGVEEVADGEFSMNDETGPALEYFKELNDSGFMPTSVWTAGDDASATFKSGQVTAYMSGVWQIADFQANISDFEWASVPLPQQPVRATNYGAASWVVGFDGTGNEEATLDFIEWMYSPENYTEYCSIQGCLPSIEGIEPTYEDNAEAFELYNAEIAASPEISARQTTDQLRDAYLGRALTSEPLRDETVRYLSGELDLDATIEAILASTREQLG